MQDSIVPGRLVPTLWILHPIYPGILLNNKVWIDKADAVNIVPLVQIAKPYLGKSVPQRGHRNPAPGVTHTLTNMNSINYYYQLNLSDFLKSPN